MLFTDPSTGVSFRYPRSWKFSRTQNFYLPASVLTVEPEKGDGLFARGAVYRYADRWPGFERTNLNGADFVFNTVPGIDRESCLNWLDKAHLDPTDERTLHGIVFTHLKRAGAGLCHQEYESIYLMQTHNTCYFFDLAVNTICSGVADGIRDMSPRERREVRADLSAIMGSVRINVH